MVWKGGSGMIVLDDYLKDIEYTCLPDLSVNDDIYVLTKLNNWFCGFDDYVFLEAKVTWSSNGKYKHEATVEDYNFGKFDIALDCNHLYGYDDSGYIMSIVSIGMIYNYIFDFDVGVKIIKRHNTDDYIERIVDAYTKVLDKRLIDFFQLPCKIYPDEAFRVDLVELMKMEEAKKIVKIRSNI